MFAISLSAALAKRGIHYGWVVGAVDLPDAADDGRRDGAAGRADLAAQCRVRLEHGGHLLGARASHHAVWPDGTFRGGALMNRYGLRNVAVASALLICVALVGRDADARILADAAAVGPRRRIGDRAHRHGVRRDGRQSLVRQTAWPDGRAVVGEQRHGPARLPAARRLARHACRMARGAAAVRHRRPDLRPPGDPVPGRPAR